MEEISYLRAPRAAPPPLDGRLVPLGRLPPKFPLLEGLEVVVVEGEGRDVVVVVGLVVVVVGREVLVEGFDVVVEAGFEVVVEAGLEVVVAAGRLVVVADGLVVVVVVGLSGAAVDVPAVGLITPEVGRLVEVEPNEGAGAAWFTLLPCWIVVEPTGLRPGAAAPPAPL